MHYERLTASDTAFLRIETAHEPQHVGSVSVLEGGPLRDPEGRIRFATLREHVAARLHRVPRMRQRLMEVPYGQGRPVWVDDDHFDLDHHVRLTALPRPGNAEQLATLMGRLQSQALDRDRPLWEMWFVDGMDSEDVALIIKTHHALGDGIANVDLALALVDLEPDPPPAAGPPAWVPRPAPSPGRLLTDSVRDRIERPGRIARSAAGAVRDPRPAADATTNLLRTVRTFLARPDPAPWNVPITGHRRWAPASVPFETVRRARRGRDVTINDVVLAACTGTLRRYLVDRGIPVDDRVLKAMVPVSLRGESEHGDALGNRISLIVVDLPVDETDPERRVERIHAQVAELRGAGITEGAQKIIELADGITPLAAPLTRIVSRAIPMNLVITNIPGPPVPLYLLGSRVLRTHPYVEVIDNEGLTIAVVSYDEHLFFGITSDRDVIPDLADVAVDLESRFEQLADTEAARA